jgi:hypothetical protein
LKPPHPHTRGLAGEFAGKLLFLDSIIKRFWKQKNTSGASPFGI